MDETRDRTLWSLLVLAVAVAVVAVVAVVLVVANNDDAPVVASTADSQPDDSAADRAEPEAFPADVDPFDVVFPPPTTSRRFDDPSAAAAAYSTDVLGFGQMSMGEFVAGDARSGEVVVADGPGGAATTVMLRLMEDETWFVLGSVAQDITVESPAPFATVASPVETAGSALAFEGTVDVEVWTQTGDEPVGAGFVTGSGTPPAGPFAGEIEFSIPDSPSGDQIAGIIIYRILSAEDGHVVQASSVPVRLTRG